MEPILFYGVPQGCSFGSIVALEWLGEPYRLCRVNMPDDMQNERYDAINPVRETPAMLLENGAAISESAAILLHIAARGVKSKLGFAPGTLEFDRLNQTLAFLNTTFFSAFNPLWLAYEMEANPPVQETLRAVGRDAVRKAHRQLDAMLAGCEWLVGDSRTVVDAYFVGIVRWARYHRVVEQSDYPNVRAHFQKLESDPAVVFAHAIEAELPATSRGGFRGHVSLDDAVSLSSRKSKRAAIA